MHSLQPQQNAQLRPRGHDENILEEAYRGRYARQRLLNCWPESSCGYHAIKRFVCIIQVIVRAHRTATEFNKKHGISEVTFHHYYLYGEPGVGGIFPPAHRCEGSSTLQDLNCRRGSK